MSLEHVSTVVPRALPLAVQSPTILDAPAAPKEPRTLPELVEVFLRDEALDNDDAVLPLSGLRLETDDRLEVPNRGTFTFTDWSRRQISSLLGLQWDRYFAAATPAERCDELNRRFRRATGLVKLRTRRHAEPGQSDSGTLRAVVTRGYTPVSDVLVGRMLAEALAPIDNDFKLIRHVQTDMTTSYVVKVGQAFRPGDSHEVGDVWGGVLVRNSGVGFASLMVSLSLTRLLCKNGMCAPVDNPILLKRAHRGLSEERLRQLFAAGLEDAPGKLRAGAEALRQSRDRHVRDVRAELQRLLDRSHLPHRLMPALLAAYHAEPEPSAFGIAQALTRAAQGTTAEERVLLERAAGTYLAATN